MIQFDGYTFRNIQEQVAQNASDIADLDSKIDETKEEITGGSPYTIDMIYQQNVGQDNSIALLQSGKQNKLTAGDGISIDEDNVISSTASGGTQLYIHKFTWNSGLSNNFTYVIGAYISNHSTPVTNFRTMGDIIFNGNASEAAKTARTGFATAGSLTGTFMFTTNSVFEYAMIVFETDGSTSAATIGSNGNLKGTWTETVTEL